MNKTIINNTVTLMESYLVSCKPMTNLLAEFQDSLIAHSDDKETLLSMFTGVHIVRQKYNMDRIDPTDKRAQFSYDVLTVFYNATKHYLKI